MYLFHYLNSCALEPDGDITGSTSEMQASMFSFIIAEDIWTGLCISAFAIWQGFVCGTDLDFKCQTQTEHKRLKWLAWEGIDLTIIKTKHTHTHTKSKLEMKEKRDERRNQCCITCITLC